MSNNVFFESCNLTHIQIDFCIHFILDLFCMMIVSNNKDNDEITRTMLHEIGSNVFMI